MAKNHSEVLGRLEGLVERDAKVVSATGGARRSGVELSLTGGERYSQRFLACPNATVRETSAPETRRSES